MENTWSIKTIYTLPNGIFMDKWMQDKIEKTIKSSFLTEKINFVWGDLPQREVPQRPEEPTIDEIWFSDFQQRWDQFFQDNLPEAVSIKNLEIKWKKEDNCKKVFIYFDLQIPKNYESFKINDFEQKLKNYSKSFDRIFIEIIPKVFKYTTSIQDETILLVEEE
jgi:hypothetical protein